MFDWLKSPWHRAAAARLAAQDRPKRVTIEFSDLELIWKDFDESTKGSGAALGWLGLLVGIGTALGTGDFSYDEERFWLSGSQWYTVLIIGIAASGVLFVIAAWRSLRAPQIDHFLSQVADVGGAKAEHRALFILKHSKPGSTTTRLLCYKSATWDCWLLPNMSTNSLAPSTVAAKVTADLAAQLGVEPGKVVATEIPEVNFTSTKHSAWYNTEKTYVFRFYFVNLSGIAANSDLRKNKFRVGSRQFAWKTVDELQTDPTAMRLNGDVIKQISENRAGLLQQTTETLAP